MIKVIIEDMDINLEKEYEIIEKKYENLINISKDYMSKVDDPKHSTTHMESVVKYVKEILKFEKEADKEVCIVSAYWHDVGRIYGQEGHAKMSAKMIQEEMKKQNYDKNFIEKCVKAIENHSTSAQPETLEGIIVRDADKIDFVGISRWKFCIENNCRFNKILDRLPIMRTELLKLESSKQIFDREIGELIRYLHNIIFKI